MQVAIVGAFILHGFPSHLEMNMQLVKHPRHGICVIIFSSFDFIVVFVMASAHYVKKCVNLISKCLNYRVFIIAFLLPNALNSARTRSRDSAKSIMGAG